MPDSQGNIKGIAVPRIPWLEADESMAPMVEADDVVDVNVGSEAEWSGDSAAAECDTPRVRTRLR